MDNSENLTKTECECGINYESEYLRAMKRIDMLLAENKSLKIVVKELSKIIFEKEPCQNKYDGRGTGNRYKSSH